MGAEELTADKPPQLELPIRRMLELERAEKIVTALAGGELPALTDAELEQIIAIAGEDAPLFDPDTLELDGWRRDHNRSWVPPGINAIDARPVRSPNEPAGGASGTPAQKTAAQKTAAQKTAAQKTAAQKTCRAHSRPIPRRVRSYQERRAEGTVGERPRELDSPLGPAGRLDRTVGRTPAPISRRSRARFPWFVVTT